MTTNDEPTADIIAAEYVLGTLGANEREEAEGKIASDPAFAALVQHWERRLGELNVMVGEVEPPAETWGRINARIEGVEPSAMMQLPDPMHAARSAAASNVIAMRRRLGRWRGATAGLAALAAVLTAIVVTAALKPEALPPQFRPKPIEIVRTIEKPAPSPGRFIAVLQRDAASPAFILTVDTANRNLMVRRVSAEPQTGKSYELWLVSNRFPAPRSLGVVGVDEFTPRPTLVGYDPAIISDATFAISLEPEGGSPTGAPSEVLFTGKLVESVPDMAPSR